MTEKLMPSWPQIHMTCLSIKRQLVVRPKRIVGVARGGLIPAVILSHILDVREFHIVHCSSYGDDHKQGSLSMYVPGQTEEVINRPDTLIVDDICDTTTTHSVLRHHAGQAWIAVLYAKQIPNDPKLVIGQTIPDIWVEFPWEDKL